MRDKTKLSTIFLGVILMALTAVSTSQAAESDVCTLPNGLKVVLHQDRRFPLVSMRLFVQAGSAYETDKEAGISHLLEHMAFKGTGKRPPGMIAEDVEKVGGYLNASTSFDYTVYIADLPARHWKLGLDVLKDMVCNASIIPEELESEKEVVIAELKRGNDNPDSRIFEMLQKYALDGTPYQRPIIGYEEILRSISRQDILNYMEKHYQPQTMMLLICGDFELEPAKAEIAALYAPLQNSRDKNMLKRTDFSTLQLFGPTVMVEKGPWNKVYLGLALPSINQGYSRSVHLDVLSSLLGDGKTSYLYRKYKYELRLVDNISIASYDFERCGLLYMHIVLDADKLDEFWNLFSRELAGLSRVEFTPEELERVKLNLEDDLFRAKETLSGLASKLGYFEFFDNGEQGEKNYLYLLRATTLENLKGQLDDILVPAHLAVAMLIPEDAAASITPESMKQTLAINWPQYSCTQNMPAKVKNFAKPEILKLGPGRKLILIPDATLPYVSANFMFAGGDAILDRTSQGLSSFTASLLIRGTAKLGATAIEDYLADRAASLNASSGRQTFGISFSFPARFGDDIFDLLLDTLNNPAFAQEELERVRQNQISGIKASEDQPLGLAFRRMFPFLFGDHPYGFIQAGTAESVAALTREQVFAFWEKQKKQPWVLAVCGDFDREKVLTTAKKLPQPGKEHLELATPSWTVEKNLELRLPDRQQAHILLIFPTVEVGNKDEAALNVMQAILSGQSGLLFMELRDRQGLGYTVTAMPWNSQKTGLLIFYIGTEPDKMQQAKDGFREIVTRLRTESLPEAILERGKQSIEGEYY